MRERERTREVMEASEDKGEREIETEKERRSRIGL